MNTRTPQPYCLNFIVVTFNGKKRCLFCENSGKTMSEYFKNLSKTGDPFLISSEWVNDVSKWPEVEFGQIGLTNLCVRDRFAWSIHPRYNESLEFPRSISAIFYGWVRTCYLLEVNNTLLLKAKVMRFQAPAQALTDTPHEAWCAFDKSDAPVLTGYRTCMAG